MGRVNSIVASYFKCLFRKVTASVMTEVLYHSTHACDRFRAFSFDLLENLFVWSSLAREIILALVLSAKGAILGLIVSNDLAKLIIAELA